MHCLHRSSVHSSLNRESPVVKGSWVLERGVLSADPGRGQLLAVKRQPEGTGARGATTGKVCGKSLRHYSTVTVKQCARGRTAIINPSLPTSFFSLCRHWKGLPPEQARPPLRLVLPPPALAPRGLSTAHPKTSLGNSPGQPCLG